MNGHTVSRPSALPVDEEVDAPHPPAARLCAPRGEARHRLAFLERREVDAPAGAADDHALVDDGPVGPPGRRHLHEPEILRLPRIPTGQCEVVLPPPVPTRVGVVVEAAPTGAVRIGNLVVPDHVAPIERDAEPAGEGCEQTRRRAVLRLGEPAAPGVALVLDADRVPVRVVVARVPRDVGEVHELDDLPVARDDEVGGAVRAAVPQPRHGAPEAALGDVDDDLVDARRAPRRRVVRRPHDADRRFRCPGVARLYRRNGSQAQRRDDEGNQRESKVVHVGGSPAGLGSRQDRAAL